MDENLLSIFPLPAAMYHFARLTCLQVTAQGLMTFEPRTMLREELYECLNDTSFGPETESIMENLNDGVPIYLIIVSADAATLGLCREI